MSFPRRISPSFDAPRPKQPHAFAARTFARWQPLSHGQCAVGPNRATQSQHQYKARCNMSADGAAGAATRPVRHPARSPLTLSRSRGTAHGARIYKLRHHRRRAAAAASRDASIWQPLKLPDDLLLFGGRRRVDRRQSVMQRENWHRQRWRRRRRWSGPRSPLADATEVTQVTPREKNPEVTQRSHDAPKINPLTPNNNKRRSPRTFVPSRIWVGRLR